MSGGPTGNALGSGVGWLQVENRNGVRATWAGISIPRQKPFVSGHYVCRCLVFDDPERVLFPLVKKRPVVGDELSEVAF